MASEASSNSAATAPELLKSSSMAALKAWACGSFQSMPWPSAGTFCKAWYRRSSAFCASTRLSGA
ncbi:hypothetical protein D3C74_478730 [compost metagenome]